LLGEKHSTFALTQIVNAKAVTVHVTLVLDAGRASRTDEHSLLDCTPNGVFVTGIESGRPRYMHFGKIPYRFEGVGKPLSGLPIAI
jgi:hypothetical protein